MAVFDDEQIADEQSVANMNVKFAGLEKVFAQEDKARQSENSLLILGKLIKKSIKFFDFKQNSETSFLKNFFQELQTVNFLELDELKQTFSELENLDKLTPEIVEKPINVEMLNQKLAKNEILCLKKLFEMLFETNDENTKKLFERMIFRRIDSFLKMFFD